MSKALNEGRGVRALAASRVMRAIGSAALVTTMAAERPCREDRSPGPRQTSSA